MNNQEIVGMFSAHTAAKKMPHGSNMTISAALVIEMVARIAELETGLVNVRDILNSQEDKSCLGSGYDPDCAPWDIVDEVINGITQALKA